jgi:ABC-type antimicrobial peptide transport system permease subunit
MKLLIGNTGLVGSTILESETFEHTFNSKNLDTFNKIAGNGDELFLTCLPATKWMVNKNLTEDIQNIHRIINTISQREYSKITLISTIDVYNDSPLGVDETYSPNISKLSYGNNRYLFELMVREMVKTDDLKIFRLPALFNKNIKKNVLFDLIHNNNVEQINQNSFFQWYNLDNLKSDIEKFSTEYPDESVYNLFTEPIYTSDIVELFPEHMDKVQNGSKVIYDYHTKFGGYILNKHNVLKEIKQFINESSVK